MSDTELLQEFVRLMNAGEFDAARQMVSDDVVIREPEAIPYGGTFEGLHGFDEFRRIFGRTWSRWVDGPMWYAEADGTVVKRNRITATSRATGKVYETALAELFTFRDGKIVEVEIFYQDIPSFLAAIEP